MRINKKEKKLHSIFVLLLMISIITASPFLYIQDLSLSASEYTVYAESYEALSGYATVETITKHGNVGIYIEQKKLAEAGYEAGDVITLEFLNQQIDIPYCTGYSDVDSGETGLFAVQTSDYVVAAINMGNFAATYGIATKDESSGTWTMNEGVGDTLNFTVNMKEKGGYYAEYVVRSLSYTNARENYPDLTDEEFANFRAVNTTGIGTNRLYRTSSPVDDDRGRNKYADAAIKNAKVTVVINMADEASEIKEFEGFSDTYYSTLNYLCLDMSMDYNSDEYREKLVDGYTFMADNPGVYAIHCLEGKDRTGFAAAVLECLMGADAEEIISDYMISFYNFYGVTVDDSRYNAIAQGNIVKSLKGAFGTDDLENADLASEAYDYLIEIGMSEEKIEALKKNLAADNKGHDDPELISNCSVSLNRTEFVYSGKIRKPVVTVKDAQGNELKEGSDYELTNPGRKNVGKGKVKIEGTGNYTGSLTLTYKVVPKKASLRSIKKKGRVLTVKMSSRPYKRGAAYYQVAYRIKESSKWKYKTAASGTVKIKKLKKGREYIVKVRAYKKVKGIRYYGEWSRTRSVS